MNQAHTELQTMPEHVLFHLARNESADKSWRKQAVVLMLEKGYRSAHNPELTPLLEEILKEREARQEVTAAVEAAVETPEEDWPTAAETPPAEVVSRLLDSGISVPTVIVPPLAGPPAASVTTSSLMHDYEEDPAKEE